MGLKFVHGNKEFGTFFRCIKSFHVKGNYFEIGFLIVHCFRFHGGFMWLYCAMRCGLWQEDG